MKLSVIQLSAKRIKYLIGAIVVFVVAPELINGGVFDWRLVLEQSQVAVGYWLVTTFRDWQDPTIPNNMPK